MSDADLEGKLRTSAAGANLGHDASPLIDAVWALDKSARRREACVDRGTAG